MPRASALEMVFGYTLKRPKSSIVINFFLTIFSGCCFNAHKM